MKYLIYQITLLYKCFQIIGFRKIYKYYDKSSNNVILIYPSTFLGWINYVIRASVLHDLSLIFSLISLEKKFRLVLRQDFGKLRNCNIYYSFSDLVNQYSFDNHSLYLYNVLELVKGNNNKLFPDSSEIMCWENKIYMHKLFDELNIKCPKSISFTSENFDPRIIESNLKYPFLIKEPFSNHSRGIYFINNRKELISRANKSFKTVSNIIVQEIINMTKDARVVVVGDSVVYSYWRSKEESETFKTTSTSNGAKLDFSLLSKKNNQILINYTKALKLSVAAFDVTFNNDDESTDPIVLEVSSSFLINPIPFGKYIDLPYLNFKSNPILFGKERAIAALDFKLNVFKHVYEKQY